MPAEWQPANQDDRERFPKLKADLGEDPARWLDAPLVEYGENHTDHTRRRMVRDRVQSIDDVSVCRAWIAIERRLDRGPRDTVMEWLEERLAFLEEHGDRDERIAGEVPLRPRVAPRTADDYREMLDDVSQFAEIAGLEHLLARANDQGSSIEEPAAADPSSTSVLAADGGASE